MLSEYIKGGLISDFKEINFAGTDRGFENVFRKYAQTM